MKNKFETNFISETIEKIPFTDTLSQIFLQKVFSALGRTRTHNLLFRRQALYPVELQVLFLNLLQI